MKRMILALTTLCVIFAAVFFVLHGTGKELLLARAGGQPKRPVTIMLFACSGIRDATVELVEAFESRTGIQVDATYGTCGQLMAAISAAPHRGDVYMPGAKAYVQRAIDKGLVVPETQRDLISFTPVIFVQKGNPKGIETLWDLARPGLRLGFGDERATVIGERTMEILEKNNIPYEEIEPNVVYKAATSNPLGFAVQTEAVDAVITWDANARHFAEYGDIIEIPPAQNAPTTIPIAMLTACRRPQEARQFIDFVASEEGMRIMEERGYSPLNP